MTLNVYHFSLVRFVPDIARGEAANVGVIVVDNDAGRVASEFLPDSRPKIRALAPGFNIAAIAEAIDSIRRRLDAYSQPGSGNAWITSSEQLRVLAGAMRNQLQLSEPKPFRASSLDGAARYLYDSLVRPIDSTAQAREVGATTL